MSLIGTVCTTGLRGKYVRYFKYIIVLALLCGGIFAQHRQIRYVGANPESVTSADSIATRFTGLSEFVNVSIPRILEGYRGAGYYRAQVDSVVVPGSASTGPVMVHLTPGEQIERVRLLTSGDTLTGPAHQDPFGDVNDQKALWQHRLRRITEEYANQGYPLVQWGIDSFAIRKHEIRIYGTLRPGAGFRIDTMGVVHDGLTRDQILLRETRIPLGSPYDLRRIRRAKRRLAQLPYIGDVSDPYLIYTTTEKQGLLWEIQEREANRFSGLAGYVPATETRSGYFTGQLEFDFLNLFGTGRQLRIFWEKRDVISQEMELNYTEPWVGGLPLDISGMFRQTVQDSSYIERRFSLRSTFQVNWHWNVFAEISRGAVMTTPFGAREYQLSDYQRTDLTAGVTYNSMNDLLNPSSGIRYHHVFTRRSNIRGMSEPVRALDFAFQRVQPVYGSHVLSGTITIHNLLNATTALPVSEYYRFGGTESVRGYDESVYPGTTVGWMNLEYRLLFEKRSRLITFLDYGYWEKLSEGGKQKGTISSIGFGLRLATPVGQLGIDYGVPSGAGWRRGRLHIRVFNHF